MCPLVCRRLLLGTKGLGFRIYPDAPRYQWVWIVLVITDPVEEVATLLNAHGGSEIATMGD